MSLAAADRLLRLANTAVAERGVFTIALSGGNTPAPLYALLAASPWRERMPWASMQIYWGDERCVPPEDPESNFALAWRLLLADLALSPEQIHRIIGEDPDAGACRRTIRANTAGDAGSAVARDRRRWTYRLPLPGSPALQEQTRRVVAIADAPKPPPQRITVTPPVIQAARHLLVLAAGAAKAAPVVRALTGADDLMHTPAQLARRGLWYLDAPAAAGLGQH